MLNYFKDLKKDFLTKKFMPLKILHFFMIGGMTTLFPFLTIQARSLGITGEELGIIYGLLPVVGIFAPSLAGLLADKIGNFKIFVSLSVVCSGLASLLFILIPAGRIEHKLPEQLPLTLECSATSLETIKPQLPCTLVEERKSFINISQCSIECPKNYADSNTLHNNIQKWCNGNKDCEIVDDIGNVSKHQTQYEIVGHHTKDYKTFYFFNNISMPILKKKNENINITESFCPDREVFLDSSEANSNRDNRNSSAIPPKCYLKCEAFALSSDICKNDQYTETIDPALTVIIYIIVRLINGLTLATSFTLFEGAVVAILKENDGNLGLQRMYGNLGQIVMTPISGLLIDHFSKINNKEDYTPAFFMYCGIKFVCAIFFLMIDLDFKEPSKRVLKDFKDLLRQPKVFTFITFIIIVGTCYGFVETFLFWLLEDLGADKSLMGMTVTVGAAVGIPLLMVSSFFIEKVGHVNTMTICSFVFVIRFVGYSLITNPWMAMPFEALESFTNSLFAVASISYAGILSNPSTVASMQGLLGGTYHGVGRGIGSLAGGVMIKRLGNRLTFQILGALCGVGGLLYFLVNLVFLKQEKVRPTDDIKSPIQDENSSDTPVSTLKEQKLFDESSLNSPDNYGSTHNNTYNTSNTNGVENPAFNDDIKVYHR